MVDHSDLYQLVSKQVQVSTDVRSEELSRQLVHLFNKPNCQDAASRPLAQEAAKTSHFEVADLPTAALGLVSIWWRMLHHLQ